MLGVYPAGRLESSSVSRRVVRNSKLVLDSTFRSPLSYRSHGTRRNEAGDSVTSHTPQRSRTITAHTRDCTTICRHHCVARPAETAARAPCARHKNTLVDLQTPVNHSIRFAAQPLLSISSRRRPHPRQGILRPSRTTDCRASLKLSGTKRVVPLPRRAAGFRFIAVKVATVAWA